jgi:hypothetical protein
MKHRLGENRLVGAVFSHLCFICAHLWLKTVRCRRPIARFPCKTAFSRQNSDWLRRNSDWFHDGNDWKRLITDWICSNNDWKRDGNDWLRRGNDWFCGRSGRVYGFIVGQFL